MLISLHLTPRMSTVQSVTALDRRSRGKRILPNMMAAIAIMFLLFAQLLPARGQSDHTAVRGYIYDQASRTALVGANIYCRELNTGTVSNNEGYFAMHIPKAKSTTLSVSYIGYADLNIALTGHDTFLVLYLALDTMSTVEVRATHTHTATIDVSKLDTRELNSMPLLMGEKDILKALTLLPGVGFG